MNNNILLLGLGAVALIAISNKQNVNSTDAATAAAQNVGAGADSRITKSNDITIQSYVSGQQNAGVDNATIINNAISQIGPSGINGSWINGQFVANPNPVQTFVQTIPQILSISGAPIQLSQNARDSLITFMHNNPNATNAMTRDQYGADITEPISVWKQYLQVN